MTASASLMYNAGCGAFTLSCGMVYEGVTQEHYRTACRNLMALLHAQAALHSEVAAIVFCCVAAVLLLSHQPNLLCNSR
jgi:hypothetical protein